MTLLPLVASRQTSKNLLLSKLAEGLSPDIDPIQGIYTGDDPITFLEKEMYLADTRQPMVLHPEQKAVLREMFRRDARGFVYNLMLYSAPKKSAKTTIVGGLALWQAFRVPHGEIYIIGNDQNQADSKMAESIRSCIALNPRMKGIKVPLSTYRIRLPNGTKIDSIPVDPTGESGMNPSGIFMTEAWGAKKKAHEMLWTEARLSPTREGESFKMVESYAGHSGESNILERLYKSIIQEGTPLNHIAPELYASDTMIGYWCTRHYLPWQTESYLRSEEKDMLPIEYRRVHWNEWGVSEDAFVDVIWWDAAKVERIEVTNRTPLIMGVDAGISSDWFAIICLMKLPIDRDTYAVTHVKVFEPPQNGEIDYQEAEQYIRDTCKTWNVVEIAYDKYQLHHMMQKFYQEQVCRVYDFNQGEARALADKDLRDAIMARHILHDGNEVLRTAIKNANAKTEGNDSKLRLVKRSPSLKIDPAVALSMAYARARQVNL